MVSSSIARRSSFLRTMMKSTSRSSSPSTATTSSPRSTNILFPDTRTRTSNISHQSPSRLLRRELSSLLPVHSATASACLVSKLFSEVSTSNEGIFANYLSPI